MSSARKGSGKASVAPVPSAFDELVGQPRVVSFFKAAQTEGRFTHAFLFVGPLGSGKTDAARALARALLCENGGADNCAVCARISRGKHPDVQIIEPEGVSGYLTEQIRDLIHEVSLAPIQASGKVYIINRVDLLRDAAANAFLKTIEEPPEGVTFILLSRTRDSVLETIVSRCQVVAFRSVPEEEALSFIQAKTGAEREAARVALMTSGGSLTGARSYLASPSQQELRRLVINKLENLPAADELTILDGTRELVTACKSSLDEVRLVQEDEMEAVRESLAKGALSRLEKRHKRELSQQERESLRQVFQVARLWLRDCLACATGGRAIIVNTDCYRNIERIADASEPTAFIDALSAVERAEERVSYNVTPQLVIEAMLFDIKEALNA